MDINTQVSIWREKCRQGIMTIEEYREALQVLRGGRELALKKSTSTKVKPQKTSDDLLSELGDL